MRCIFQTFRIYADNSVSIWACLFALNYIRIEYIGSIQLVVKHEDQRMVFKHEHKTIFLSREIESKMEIPVRVKVI